MHHRHDCSTRPQALGRAPWRPRSRAACPRLVPPPRPCPHPWPQLARQQWAPAHRPGRHHQPDRRHTQDLQALGAGHLCGCHAPAGVPLGHPQHLWWGGSRRVQTCFAHSRQLLDSRGGACKATSCLAPGPPALRPPIIPPFGVLHPPPAPPAASHAARPLHAPCLPGVLRYKRLSEQALEQSGLPWTILRPSRLTDGPYTSYDLNTLLRNTAGSRQDVQLAPTDSLAGEASRIAVAGEGAQSHDGGAWRSLICTCVRRAGVCGCCLRARWPLTSLPPPPPPRCPLGGLVCRGSLPGAVAAQHGEQALLNHQQRGGGAGRRRRQMGGPV